MLRSSLLHYGWNNTDFSNGLLKKLRSKRTNGYLLSERFYQDPVESFWQAKGQRRMQ